jgi:hypothetical protein
MSNTNFKVINEKRGEISGLIIEGNLVLTNISEIKEKLIPMSMNKRIKFIDVKNVLDIDISFIQLLKSFQLTMDNISFNFELSGEHQNLLQKAALFEGFHLNKTN